MGPPRQSRSECEDRWGRQPRPAARLAGLDGRKNKARCGSKQTWGKRGGVRTAVTSIGKEVLHGVFFLVVRLSLALYDPGGVVGRVHACV